MPTIDLAGGKWVVIPGEGQFNSRCGPDGVIRQYWAWIVGGKTFAVFQRSARNASMHIPVSRPHPHNVERVKTLESFWGMRIDDIIRGKTTDAWEKDLVIEI